MKAQTLKKIAAKYLLPLFSGAKLEEEVVSSTPGQATVSHRGPCEILFKVNRSDNFRIVISRSQPFDKLANDVVSEMGVVRAFVSILAEMEDVIESEFANDLLSTFQRRVIARALSKKWENTLLSGMDYLSAWGSKLYEGAAISASIGFRNMKKKPKSVSLEEVTRSEFGAVLSNGNDTILEFNYHQQLISVEALNPADKLPSFCPFRQGNIGKWTTKHEDRIALVLNRLGEILIFRKHNLLFARRAGQWHFLTHEPVIKQMNVPRLPVLRRAIYETCLDASFARTGACLGVVQIGHGSDWRKVVAEDDLIKTGSSLKARALSQIINGRKFHDLDRRTRQEIVAIDGATVVSHKGDILAAGAILKIASGSDGGGRRAAAKALSNFGLGIKVSQDGGIIGFRPKAEAFRVM